MVSADERAYLHEKALKKHHWHRLWMLSHNPLLNTRRIPESEERTRLIYLAKYHDKKYRRHVNREEMIERRLRHTPEGLVFLQRIYGDLYVA